MSDPRFRPSYFNSVGFFVRGRPVLESRMMFRSQYKWLR